MTLQSTLQLATKLNYDKDDDCALNFIYVGRNICKGIRLAAKHWRQADIESSQKYSNLEKDIMNAFLHYIGIHENCAEYFCSKTTNAEVLETVKVLKETGVYYEVLDLIQKYFGNNVKSLVAGLCTNKTEGFNSLIAKGLGKNFSFCIGLIRLKSSLELLPYFNLK